jgi:hypothetical protein
VMTGNEDGDVVQGTVTDSLRLQKEQIKSMDHVVSV